MEKHTCVSRVYNIPLFVTLCSPVYSLSLPTVQLVSTTTATIEGFMVEARESDGSFEEDFEEGSTIWGTWVIDPNSKYHAIECNRGFNSSEGPFEVSYH